jgi:choline dehydrogenase-like flavoprotein
LTSSSSGLGGRRALAANLARANYTVALMEGSDPTDDNLNYSVRLHARATETPMRWDFFVQHYTDPQRQKLDTKYYEEADGRIGPASSPRAGTLGGCTSHNAMITVYPHNEDWEHLRELTGDESWSAERMRLVREAGGLRLCPCVAEHRPPRFQRLAGHQPAEPVPGVARQAVAGRDRGRRGPGALEERAGTMRADPPLVRLEKLAGLLISTWKSLAPGPTASGLSPGQVGRLRDRTRGLRAARASPPPRIAWCRAARGRCARC